MLIEITLYGHSGAKRTDFKGMEGRGWAIPIPFTIVFNPFAKVIVERVERVGRVEKVFLLLEIWSEAL